MVVPEGFTDSLWRGSLGGDSLVRVFAVVFVGEVLGQVF